jgi:hypothetical protein
LYFCVILLNFSTSNFSPEVEILKNGFIAIKTNYTHFTKTFGNFRSVRKFVRTLKLLRQCLISGSILTQSPIKILIARCTW